METKPFTHRHGRGYVAAFAAVLMIAVDLLAVATSASAAPATGFVGVASGRSHSCVIAEESAGSAQGRVWCWGANDAGQLGTHTDTDQSATPVLVNLIDDAVQITAGARHTCALRSDQTVWCWGADNTGQLGDGTTQDSTTPVQVAGLTGVVQVAAGRAHTCARTTAGAVSCWGSNAFGALGDSSITDVPFGSLGVFSDSEDSIAISADGETLYVATAASGSVYIVSISGNLIRQIGVATPLSSALTVAPAPDGTWFVAQNSTIQRRDDTGAILQTFGVPCPQPLCELQGIAVDGHGTLFATWTDAQNDGTIAAFAPQANGDVLTTPTWTRDTVDPNPNFPPPDLQPTDLAARTDDRGVTKVYLRAGSRVVTYSAAGFTLTSIHGTGTDDCDGAIAAGNADLGVDPDGDLLLPSPSADCVNRFAADGTFLDSFGESGAAPGQLARPTDIVADPLGNLYVIDASNMRVQRFDRAGTVAANWGRRQFSSLPLPVQVGPVDASTGSIGTGAHHTCASLGDSIPREVWCWGDNGAGQVKPANFPYSSTSIPVQAPGNDFGAVGGADHTCGVDNGTPTCWGDNGSGQLGDGTTTPRSSEVTVVGVSDAVELSAGSASTCALLDGGTVHCWGSDAAGQRGDGPGVGDCTPPIGGDVVGDDPGCGFLTGITQLGAGAAHACVIADAGASVYCWGRNDEHQLGAFPDPQSSHAVKIEFPDIADLVDVAITPSDPGPDIEVTGSLTVTFTMEVTSVPPGSIMVTALDGTPVPFTTICRDGDGVIVDCVTGPVSTVELVPDSPLTPGESYVVTVNPPGVTDPVTWAGEPVQTTKGDPILVDPKIDESSPVVKESWSRAHSRAALGHRYAYTRQAGASASYAFTGKRVTLITMRGPGQGVARLSIDGVQKKLIDTRSKHKKFRARYTVRGLVDGPHVLTVKVARRPGTPHGGSVVIDGIEFRHAGTITVDTNAKAAVYRWPTRPSQFADGGRYDASRTRGTRTTVRFAGTQIEWQTLTGPRQGNARVKIDGIVVRTVHTYKRTPLQLKTYTFSGLAPGPHRLTIAVLGTGRGRLHNVAIDGFLAG